jgi:hypothetical protein
MRKIYSLLGLFALVVVAPAHAQAPLCSTPFVTGACGSVQCEQARSCISGVVNSWAGGRCNIARAAEAQGQIASECAACNQVCSSPTAWMQGSWSGTGSQSNSSGSWSMQLSVAGSSYSISYPSLGCGGYWSLNNTGQGVASFVEHITYGRDKCVDGGAVTVGRLSASQMQFRWAGQGIQANATLTRH